MFEKKTISLQVVTCLISIYFIIPSSFAARINPTEDLLYLGAFRLTNPDGQLNYGGDGMSFNPLGDPAGSADGYPGSLFVVGHESYGKITEISIPAPVISKNITELPYATVIQNFNDITGGRIDGSLTGTRMGDIQVLPPAGDRTKLKLFWVDYTYYMPDPDKLTFGWSELNLQYPNPQGVWRVSETASSLTSKYLFEIPSEWSIKNTGGATMAVGRSRGVNGGSWGPALFAMSMWETDTPGADGSALSAVRLLSYSEENPFPPPGWSHDADNWDDGAWLNVADKSAVVLAGIKGERTDFNKLVYYGEPSPDGCGSKGWHAEPYYGCLLFYDTDELAAVATGQKETYEPKPYALLNVDYLLYNGFNCRRVSLGGVGYDRQNNLLYIMEKRIGNGTNIYDTSPIVHVWKLIDSGKSIDTMPPTPPTNISFTIQETENILTWSPSIENSGKVFYVIYRNGVPIKITRETTFTDKNFSNFTPPITYTVEARDLINNSSFKIKKILIQ